MSSNLNKRTLKSNNNILILPDILQKTLNCGIYVMTLDILGGQNLHIFKMLPDSEA